MKVYLAHSFDEERQSQALRDSSDPSILGFLEDLRKLSIVVCDPAETSVPKNDYNGRFRFCISQIQHSDALIVDATNKLGVGVGAEMMLANSLKIPVLTIAPLSSYYRKMPSLNDDEWIHPFIHGLSNEIFNSFDHCAAALRSLIQQRSLDADRRI